MYHRNGLGEGTSLSAVEQRSAMENASHIPQIDKDQSLKAKREVCSIVQAQLVCIS